MTIDDQLVKTDSEIFLNKLCKYFANIDSTLCDNIPLITKNGLSKIHNISCLQSFVLHKISENEVSSCINDIKTNSAHGMDGIPSKFVKMAKCVLVSFFTKLYNICIKEEIFPEEFKIAYVIPIPKVSTPKTFEDLRPISILSVFTKFFEKILEKIISKFLNKNHIINSSQFGYRTNSSTVVAPPEKNIGGGAK